MYQSAISAKYADTPYAIPIDCSSSKIPGGDRLRQRLVDTADSDKDSSALASSSKPESLRNI